MYLLNCLESQHPRNRSLAEKGECSPGEIEERGYLELHVYLQRRGCVNSKYQNPDVTSYLRLISALSSHSVLEAEVETITQSFFP